MNDEVGDHLLVSASHLWREKITAKDGAERMEIRYVKKAQCAHHHVHIDRTHAGTEYLLAPPALQDRIDCPDNGSVDAPDLGRLRQVPRVVDVFDRDQPHEVRMGMVVVEREFGEPANRLLGFEPVELQSGLVGTNLG